MRVTCAVASAMPSTTPSAVAEAPSVTTRNTGSRPWISSEEVSMQSEVRPSAHTPLGRRSLVVSAVIGPGPRERVARERATRQRVIWAPGKDRERGKHDRRSKRRPGPRTRPPYAEGAAPRRHDRAARWPYLHGEGPVRHKGPQGLERQSELLRARKSRARDRACDRATARFR